jgi:hypothetical protein
MPRKQHPRIAVTESKKLRERALRCHRLAVGVGNSQFANTLNAIAEEYEAKAAQAEARASGKK